MGGIRDAAMCCVEARPQVLAVSLLRFLTGAAFAVPAGAPGELDDWGSVDPLMMVRGALAWVLSIGAVYLFNGVTDIAEDRINKSTRPIARGDLDPRTAMAVVVVWASLSLLLVVDVPGPAAWMVAANLALGYLYSARPLVLKGRPWGTAGVLAISSVLAYGVGFTVTSGGAIDWPIGLIVFVAAATAWMVLVGMPAKDLTDIIGDAAAGRRTMGVRLGESRSRTVMTLMASAVAVAFGVVTWLFNLPLLTAAGYMVAGAAVVVLTGWMTSARAGRRGLRRPYRAFMATQQLVHVGVLYSQVTRCLLL